MKPIETCTYSKQSVSTKYTCSKGIMTVDCATTFLRLNGNSYGISVVQYLKHTFCQLVLTKIPNEIKYGFLKYLFAYLKIEEL